MTAMQIHDEVMRRAARKEPGKDGWNSNRWNNAQVTHARTDTYNKTMRLRAARVCMCVCMCVIVHAVIGALFMLCRLAASAEDMRAGLSACVAVRAAAAQAGQTRRPLGGPRLALRFVEVSTHTHTHTAPCSIHGHAGLIFYPLHHSGMSDKLARARVCVCVCVQACVRCDAPEVLASAMLRANEAGLLISYHSVHAALTHWATQQELHKVRADCIVYRVCVCVCVSVWFDCILTWVGTPLDGRTRYRHYGSAAVCMYRCVCCVCVRLTHR